jgi:uncharacterized protein YjiS (DUF1127 family)
MRYQELRRPRGIESLWLRLRLAVSRPGAARAAAGDLSHLSDRLLADIGVSRRESASTVAFWRIGR